jgi:hypothetical protein
MRQLRERKLKVDAEVVRCNNEQARLLREARLLGERLDSGCTAPQYMASARSINFASSQLIGGHSVPLTRGVLTSRKDYYVDTLNSQVDWLDGLSRRMNKPGTGL